MALRDARDASKRIVEGVVVLTTEGRYEGGLYVLGCVVSLAYGMGWEESRFWSTLRRDEGRISALGGLTGSVLHRLGKLCSELRRTYMIHRRAAFLPFAHAKSAQRHLRRIPRKPSQRQKSQNESPSRRTSPTSTRANICTLRSYPRVMHS